MPVRITPDLQKETFRFFMDLAQSERPGSTEHQMAAARFAFNVEHEARRNEWDREFALAQMDNVVSAGSRYYPDRLTAKVPKPFWETAKELGYDALSEEFLKEGHDTQVIVNNFFQAHELAAAAAAECPAEPRSGYKAIGAEEAKKHVVKLLASHKGFAQFYTGGHNKKADRASDTVYALLKENDRDERGFFVSPLCIDPDERGRWTRSKDSHHLVWAFGSKNTGTARKHGEDWASEHFDALAELQY